MQLLMYIFVLKTYNFKLTTSVGLFEEIKIVGVYNGDPCRLFILLLFSLSTPYFYFYFLKSFNKNMKNILK
jgi:small-conductance mechanosensitive channel